MGSNVREFNLSLKAWGDAVPELLVQRKRALVLEALRSVVQMSPVDTGFFRAQWRVMSDVDVAFGIVAAAAVAAFRAAGVTEQTVSALEIISRAMPDIQAIKPYTLVSIVNTAPYASELEDGSSTQAPRGMVAVTVERLKNSLGRP